MTFPSGTSKRPTHRDPPARTGAIFSTGLGFAIWLGLWAMLSQGRGWEFGIPVAALATLAGYRLGLNSGPLRPRALPAFLGFFLRELFLGGVDVARRALHISLPIAPAWHTFALTSTDPRVCLMLSALVGLLPGTLASQHKNCELHVHTLDQHGDWQTTIARLESLLSQLLGEAQT